MKKFVSLIVCIIVCFLTIPIGSFTFAEGKPQEVKPLTEREVFYTAESQARMSLASASQTKAFENIIYNAAIKSNTNALNLDSLDIKITEVSDMIRAVIDKYPELYNIKRWEYNYYKATNTVHELSLQYDYTADEYAVMNTAYKKIADSMLSDIKGNIALTDKEKLLILHDRLAVWCEYDEEAFEKYMETGDISLVNKDSFTIYGTLVNRTSVCQGYSKTYQYLLNQLGIENYLCSSQKLVHVWNIVKLDGVYYHVDVTYDDPTHDVLGRADHSNFLVSTAKLKENEHNETDFDTTPSDTRYDNAFWTDSESAFQLIGDNIYYTDGTAINVWNFSNDTTVPFYQNSQIWHYTRIDSDNEVLFFSGADNKIYSIDTTKSDPELKTLVETPANTGEVLLGYRLSANKYIYDFGKVNNLGSKHRRIQVKIPYTCKHENTMLDKNTFVTATCITNGHKADTVCIDCGETIANGDILPIDKNNHTNTAAKAGTAVDSTCITHGHEDDIYCLDCGNKVTNGKILPLDPKAHGSLRTINQLSASCTNKGYSGDTICSNCNKVIRKGVVTNYKPHAIVSIIEKASLSTSGSIIKVCENCNKIIGFSTISPVSNIKIKNPVYTYNNKTITPALSVKDLAGNELRKNTDYTVSYAKGRKNVGKYAVTVKFKGNYTGSKTLYFTINPQSTKISGLSAKRNQIRIKWKAKKTQTSGYEIQYSTNKNFKKSKITKVNKNKTTAAKITGLKGGKKYYIRIRTYKKVGNKKYYSGWSGIKNIKTKK